jgi:putative addiction module killer protein
MSYAKSPIASVQPIVYTKTVNIKERKIVMLRLDSGKVPFESWHDKLAIALQRAVDARLTRLAVGNFGDHKALAAGVYELRIMKGPGLRVYYGLKGDEIIVLIGGGDKASQKRDIEKAKELWRKYYEN